MGRSTLVAVVVILLLAVGALFVVQNSARSTQLSLDLGVAAWQLERPVPIPALIGVCFGAGLLVGAGSVGLRMMRLSSRIRQLEQQVVVTPTFSKNKDPGSW